MIKLIKNRYKVFLLLALFVSISNNVNAQELIAKTFNEKIELVHNISVSKEKRDSTVNKKENLSVLESDNAGKLIDQKNVNDLENKSIIINSIKNKLGIRYKWGSTGLNGYDCSGFVWRVYKETGINFTRSTAKDYWRKFLPVNDAERYKLGTLVFFSKLKHVGIVVDENGFYHASSSKGITYSKFNSYWKKRIFGFKKIN